jgi:hypothetical protein
MLSIFKRISVRIVALASTHQRSIERSGSPACRPYDGFLKERESRPLPIELKPPLDRCC